MLTLSFQLRLLYGWIMDKTAYKVAMSMEAIFLTLLVATLPLTSYVGAPSGHNDAGCVASNFTQNIST